MTPIIVLDTGPLGMITHPRPTGEALAAQTWFKRLQNTGAHFVIPEVADYELRREYLLQSKKRSLLLLDLLQRQIVNLPINTAMMLRAAEMWADVRRVGLPTAGQADLDGDCILAAQAESLGVPFVIATTNLRHLSRLVPAEDWMNIVP